MEKDDPGVQSSPFRDGSIRILTFDIDQNSIKKLSGVSRNLLMGCMHAHNELAFLNRLLCFSMNDFAEGDLHDQAKNGQMHCVMQLLAGKLFGTWEMLLKRFSLRDLPLSQEQRQALGWLEDYFGPSKSGLKSCAIKTVRDKTAFHYEGIDMGRALKHMPASERCIHLAQHPGNTLYNIGFAAVFYATFEEICRNAGKARLPYDEMATVGASILFEDLNDANHKLTMLLYGIIAGLLEEMPGSPLHGTPIETACECVPAPENVPLPAWLQWGAPNPDSTPAQ